MPDLNRRLATPLLPKAKFLTNAIALFRLGKTQLMAQFANHLPPLVGSFVLHG
jgi:hypothetical protein